MEIKTRHIGYSPNNASNIIEISFNSAGMGFTIDITDSDGLVDEDFIHNLHAIADELYEQNCKVLNKGL